MAETDFDFPVHRLTEHTPEYNVVITEMEGMKEKRRLKSTAPVRKWTLEIRGRSVDEKNEILTHFNSVYGQLNTFTWIVPHPYDDSIGSSFIVRYDSIKWGNPEGIYSVHDFEITLKEVL